VDESALEKSLVEIVIQVNGKLRGKLAIGTGSDNEEIEQQARALENVEKFLTGKSIRKIIHVPGKLVNFVVG
jgi:leucyl-tRNA synthetase